MKHPEMTARQKLELLREDLAETASLALELKQNSLSATLYFQLAALSLASHGRIDDALNMMSEMAHACQTVSLKYIDEGQR